MAKQISKKDAEFMSKPAGWCRKVVENGRDASFYPEQIEDINAFMSDALIYGKRKSRRCGWSHGLQRGAVATAHLCPDTSIYFVSMNLADAFKKIEECNKFYYKVHPDMRLPNVKENAKELRFQHSKSEYSEIIATFMPRGMPGRNIIIVIDEADHIADLEATLRAAIPNIIQGRSKIIIGGSVCRDHGPFWDLFNMDFEKIFGEKEAEVLRDHIILKEIYWWEVPWLVTTKKTMEEAKLEAPNMETKERVLKFGSDRLKLTFAILPLEDFQQEYELSAMREGSALISWDFILNCSSDPEHQFFSNLNQLNAWSRNNGYALVGGYDVGHRSNSSELTIFGYSKDTNMLIEAYKETLSRKELPDQEPYLDRVLDAVPGLTLAIDEGGVGAQMAASLPRKHPGRIVPVNLEYYNRKGVLDSYANRFFKNRIQIVGDQDRRMQIFSIKKKTGESGRVLYYVPRKEKHHADVAISQALAVNVVDSRTMAGDFKIYTSDSAMGGVGISELDYIAGGHEEFLRDVVNV